MDVVGFMAVFLDAQGENQHVAWARGLVHNWGMGMGISTNADAPKKRYM